MSARPKQARFHRAAPARPETTTCVYCRRASAADDYARAGWHCPRCEAALVALCDALDECGRPTLAWTMQHARDGCLQRLWSAATTPTLARLTWLSGFCLQGAYDVWGQLVSPDELRRRFPTAPTLAAVLAAIDEHPRLRRRSA